MIDIPKDVLCAGYEVAEWPAPGGRQTIAPVADDGIESLARMLVSAERPVLYLGAA